jgi:hypothetical protein
MAAISAVKVMYLHCYQWAMLSVVTRYVVVKKRMHHWLTSYCRELPTGRFRLRCDTMSSGGPAIKSLREHWKRHRGPSNRQGPVGPTAKHQPSPAESVVDAVLCVPSDPQMCGGTRMVPHQRCSGSHHRSPSPCRTGPTFSDWRDRRFSGFARPAYWGEEKGDVMKESGELPESHSNGTTIISI